MSCERAYWLAWREINGVGPTLQKRIASHFELLENAWKATPVALAEVSGLGAKSITQICDQRLSLDPGRLLAEHQQQNPQFWTPADPDYPRLLWEIPSPPPVLYYRGQGDLIQEIDRSPGVGIVGTRYPTEHGSRWTRKISQALAKASFTVISGLAAGIDAIAHQSCLQAGGSTLAILGTGLDVIYPPQNEKLFQHMEIEGLILSEYPNHTKPDRGNFPARNRIIAGLSRAVLVMEAPLKSGALITAHYANEFNRDVLTLPNSPDIREAHGCLSLISRGATMITSGHQVLETLGAIPQLDITIPTESAVPDSTPPANPTSPPPDLAPDLQKLLTLMPLEAISMDVLVAQSGWDTGAVSAKLVQLELMGLVRQEPGMRYRRC